MNQGGWFSKKAVFKDIARATGINHYDESTIVIGERPPPLKTDNEDVASAILYRYGKPVHDNTEEFEKPDLNGITEMLRMVDTYNDTIEVSEVTNTIIENVNTADILTISKLNPNVKEFLPTSKKLMNAAVKVDLNLKEMKEKLKTKISNTSSASSFKVKRERNLAIMTLMKLHNTTGIEANNIVKPDTLKESLANSTNNSPIKLMPPNFYESLSNKQDDNFNDKAENNTGHDVQNAVKKVTKWLESNNDVKADQSKESFEITTEEPGVSDSVSPGNGFKQTTNDIAHKKEVKQLNKSRLENRSIYLGPVTFKRKEIPVSNQSSLSYSDNITRKAPSSTYVPSQYANELSKTYMERANMKNGIEEDIWTRLEDELKKRDAICFKKKMEENERNQLTTSSIQDTVDLE